MFADTKPSSTKMFSTAKNDPLSNPKSNPKQKTQQEPQKKSQTSLNSFFQSVQKKPQEPEKDIAECILIMGDVHIPNRIDSIPNEVKKILEDNKSKFTRIICTGNFGNIETYNYFKNLLGKEYQLNFNCVKNDFQETLLNFPEIIIIKSMNIKLV